MENKWTLTINATILYCIAFVLITTLHESAHWVAGIAFGDYPILHHNYVNNGGAIVTVYEMVIIKLAGPVCSLVVGLFSYAILKKIKFNNNIKLGLIWLSFWGISNFLGYVATPFINRQGDIAATYRLLNVPFWVALIFAVVSIFLLLKFIYSFSSRFLSFSNLKLSEHSAKERLQFGFRIIMLPYIFGSILLSLIYIPFVTPILFFYPILNGLVLLGTWQKTGRLTQFQSSFPYNKKTVSILSIILLCVLVLTLQIFFVSGISVR